MSVEGEEGYAPLLRLLRWGFRAHIEGAFEDLKVEYDH